MTEKRTYSDFDLEIDRTGADYHARVLDSPAGEASGSFTLPFSDLELENFLLKVGRPRRGTRRLESPEMESARHFGSQLFDAVFQDDVNVSLLRSLDEVERRGEGLRIRLRFNNAPELASLPWEYLFSESSDQFLVLSAWTPIVRYLDLTQSIEPLTVTGPLRILAMISAPRDYPTLDIEEEWSRVEDSLAPLIDRGLVHIDRTDKATLRELNRLLRQNEYHIFHYLGHGGYNEQADDGVLVLEDEHDRSRMVAGRDLGTILRDHRSLRLAVLNACEGARASGSDPFSGTAQSLVRKGIPAVVAMQFEITDDAAIAFAQEFYAAIADGYPVDAAVAEARRAIFALGNDIEWGTPVLYLRGDGQLFEVDAASTPAPAIIPDQPPGEPDAEPDIEVAAAAGVMAVEGVADAAEELAETLEVTVEQAEDADEPTPQPEEVEDVATAGAAVAAADIAPAADSPTDTASTTAEVAQADEPAPEPEEVAGVAAAGAAAAADAPTMDSAPEVIVPPEAPVEDGSAYTLLSRRHFGLPLWGWFVAGFTLLIAFLLVQALLDGGEDITTTSGPVDEGPDAAPVTVAAPDGGAIAQRTEEPKVVDGFADDWSESIHSITPHVIYTHPLVRDGTVAREGTENRSEIHLAWDELYLYVLAFVEDDVLSAPNTGNQIWRNDAVNLNIAVIGPDGTVSSRPDADDHQLTLSPGDPFEGLAAESWHFVGDGSQFNENFEGNTPVAATHNGGYLLEAAVPWDEIGVFNPQPGDQFGLIVTVFDNDGEVSNGETLQTEIMANTPGAEFQRPQTWGTFSLVDVGVTVSAQALQTSTTAEETTTTSEETTTEAPPEETTIPLATVPFGVDYAVVAQALNEAGVRSEVRFVPSGTVPADSIAKISPGPGSEIPDGGTVFIEVSTGPPSSGYFLPFERGAFAVGVLSGDPLVTIEEDGSISGPNIDFLLQIGAKLWDDPPEIQYRFLTAAERFEALSTGAIDVLLNGTQRISSRLLLSEVLGFYEVLFPIDGVTQVLLVREEQFALELQRNADRVVIEAAS